MPKSNLVFPSFKSLVKCNITADDKLKFAKQFIRFVESGFERNLFTKSFYQRLSSTFGHIAHYDISGFYSTFFYRGPHPDQRLSDIESINAQLVFLDLTLRYPCWGDPEYTFCDVERFLIEWLNNNPQIINGLQARRNALVESIERDQLKRLSAKYAPAATEQVAV